VRTRKDLAFALRITLNSVLLTVTSDSGSVCRGVFLTRFVAPEGENINLWMKERDIAEQEKREGERVEQLWTICPSLASSFPFLNNTNRKETHYNKTWARSIHITFTARSFPTASTISLDITISPAWSPLDLRFVSSPHSFNAKAASSSRRLVARAISFKVHLTTTWLEALPSRLGVVSIVRTVVNNGSKISVRSQ
jgi:hypothetical protein